VAVLKTLEEAVEFNRPYGTELIVMFAVKHGARAPAVPARPPLLSIKFTIRQCPMP
jgi:hypothetical protein